MNCQNQGQGNVLIKTPALKKLNQSKQSSKKSSSEGLSINQFISIYDCRKRYIKREDRLATYPQQLMAICRLRLRLQENSWNQFRIGAVRLLGDKEMARLNQNCFKRIERRLTRAIKNIHEYDLEGILKDQVGYFGDDSIKVKYLKSALTIYRQEFRAVRNKTSTRRWRSKRMTRSQTNRNA